MSTINDSDKTWTELPPNRRDSDEADIQLRDIRRRLDDLEMFYKRLSNQSPTGRTTQGPQGVPGKPGASGTAALPNMIYVWHKNGKPVDFLPPDQTGLFNALLMSVGGDTVWLPSMTINMTATMTIPVGVIIRGISRQGSILSFSGAPTGIIMSGLSRLRDVRVIVDGTGFANAVGVDHTHDDAWIDNCDIVVSGGSASNTGATMGVSPIALEVWSLWLKIGSGNIIAWSNNQSFSDTSNSATWNIITTFPAGFDSTSQVRGFAMRGDASNFAIGNTASLWLCTNVPAIRAVPATVPTYSRILNSGDVVGASTLSSIYSFGAWRNIYFAFVATASSKIAYGEYSGGAWSWNVLSDGAPASVLGAYNYFSVPGGVGIDEITTKTGTGSALAILNTTFGGAISAPSWRAYTSASGVVYQVWPRNVSTSTTHVANGITGADLYNTSFNDNNAAEHISGSYYGPEVYFISNAGHLHYSNNGTSFSSGETWATGLALNVGISGGPTIIWLASAASNQPVVRVSFSSGSIGSLVEKSGDFWAAIGGSLLGVTMGSANLVFP